MNQNVENKTKLKGDLIRMVDKSGIQARSKNKRPRRKRLFGKNDQDLWSFQFIYIRGKEYKQTVESFLQKILVVLENQCLPVNLETMLK